MHAITRLNKCHYRSKNERLNKTGAVGTYDFVILNHCISITSVMLFTIPKMYLYKYFTYLLLIKNISFYFDIHLNL